MAPRTYTQRRRAEATATTRDRILGAAIDAYRERGVGATTLKAVAERADVSRGTILHHFGDAEGLLRAVLEQALASLDLPDGAVLAGVTDPRDRARRLVEAMYRFYDRSSDWWQVFTGGTDELPSDPAVARALERYEASVGQFVAEALGPLAADRVTLVTVGTLIGPSTFYPLLGAGLSLEERIEVVGDLVADLVARRSSIGG